MRDQDCGHCRYGVEKVDGIDDFLCFKDPPQLIVWKDGEVTQWEWRRPEVEGYHFCSHWEQRG